jgi:SAM-dependent methyltransferase
MTDLAQFYDDAYSHSGEEAEKWARWRALSARGKADHVVALHPASPAVVCEIGCGDGALLAELAGRGYGGEHVGYEVSPEAAKIAGARPELRVAAFDGERLPEADGAFDLGVLSHVLEHVPDPAAVVAARTPPKSSVPWAGPKGSRVMRQRARPRASPAEAGGSAAPRRNALSKK